VCALLVVTLPTGLCDGNSVHSALSFHDRGNIESSVTRFHANESPLIQYP
jgi:hypothetical protein